MENQDVCLFSLSDSESPIQVHMSTFKNKTFLNIRKYYTQNGELKPTQKGITLIKEHFDKLLNWLNENKETLKWTI